MIPNNNRYDLSDRLIHFFRDVNLESEDAPVWPQDTGFASDREENMLRPQFLLRHAIRMGRLYATWSVRKERRTIHGDRPAVCFTEMPIPAFIEAGRNRRAKGQAMSAYGLVLRKEDAFKAGARPVIYALSKNVNAKGGENDTERLLPETALPLLEQYRYVAFDPSGQPDWAHEREWRWKLDQEPWKSEYGIPPEDSLSLPGFNLDNSDFRGVGVIVGTKKEAREVIYDVLTKVDRGDIVNDHYSFVIPHEAVKDWKALRDRGELEDALRQNAIDLNSYFGMTKKKREGLVAAFKKEVRAVIRKFDEEPEVSERGNCWLWLPDNMHELTRALVEAKEVEVNRDGKYLVEMEDFAEERFSLQQRQRMTTKLAKRLRKTFGLRSDYYVVRNATGIDDLPFFNGDQVDDRLYYNSNE